MYIRSMLLLILSGKCLLAQTTISLPPRPTGPDVMFGAAIRKTAGHYRTDGSKGIYANYTDRTVASHS